MGTMEMATTPVPNASTNHRLNTAALATEAAFDAFPVLTRRVAYLEELKVEMSKSFPVPFVAIVAAPAVSASRRIPAALCYRVRIIPRKHDVPIPFGFPKKVRQ